MFCQIPPNGLNCSLHVSYWVEALIFLALARFSIAPLVLRCCRKSDFVDFTIWVTPAFMGCCRDSHYSKGSQMVSTFRQITGAKFRSDFLRIIILKTTFSAVYSSHAKEVIDDHWLNLTLRPLVPSSFIRRPIARPMSLSFILPMICNAGEDSVS
jgi:hypothetical protein